jgi:hypothetical protein
MSSASPEQQAPWTVQRASQPTTGRRTLPETQVSIRPLKKPRPYYKRSSHPVLETAEVVRIQSHILNELHGEDCEESDTWLLAHVVSESIYPERKEKTLRLRFENGKEEEIYEGFVFRPGHLQRSHRRLSPQPRPQPAEPEPPNAADIGAHVQQHEFADAYEYAHTSSVDEATDAEDEALSISDSEGTVSDAGQMPPSAHRSRSPSTSSAQPRSSDATLSDRPSSTTGGRLAEVRAEYRATSDDSNDCGALRTPARQPWAIMERPLSARCPTILHVGIGRTTVS